jgi:hypothetical protein
VVVVVVVVIVVVVVCVSYNRTPCITPATSAYVRHQVPLKITNVENYHFGGAGGKTIRNDDLLNHSKIYN